MSDERQASAIDRLVGAIGFTQMQVATTCAEGHDLTPPRPLLDALDEVRRYIAALEADRARLEFLFVTAESYTRDVVLRDDCEDGCFIRVNGSTYYGDDRTYFRAAIDAAMSSSPLAPTQEGA